MIGHILMLALVHFLKCCIFGHGVIWTMLMAYRIFGNAGNL